MVGRAAVQVRQALGNARESTSQDEQMSHLMNNTAKTTCIVIWANSKFFCLSFIFYYTNCFASFLQGVDLFTTTAPHTGLIQLLCHANKAQPPLLWAPACRVDWSDRQQPIVRGSPVSTSRLILFLLCSFFVLYIDQVLLLFPCHIPLLFLSCPSYSLSWAHPFYSSIHSLNSCPHGRKINPHFIHLNNVK